MATKIQVPADQVVFPQKCARCGDPTVAKTVRIRHLTEAAQARQATGYMLGGAIGAAIAGSTGVEEKFVSLEVPHCQACADRRRNLTIAAWVCLALSPLSMVGPALIADAFSLSSDAGTPIAIGMFLGIGLLLTSLVLFIVGPSQQTVRIRKVKDAVGGAELAFRNADYLEEFRQLNLRSLVPYALRAGLPLPVPPEQAIAIINEGIVEDRPELPSNLSGRFYRGQLYAQMQSFGQAVDDLTWVIAAGGPNMFQTNAYYLRGLSYMNLSRYTEAVADLQAFTRASSDRRKVGEAKKILKQLAAYV